MCLTELTSSVREGTACLPHRAASRSAGDAAFRRFFTPTHSLSLPMGAELGAVFAFVTAAGLILAIGEASHRRNETLRKEQGELEERVRQRTTELDSANRGLRELSARLMQLQDDERRRIAREL